MSKNNTLAKQQTTLLPDKIEDLSKFILIGREKLNSVRAEIRAIDKLKLAEDVHKQKQEEATMLAEAVLDAEVKLGELFKEIPTNQGKRTDLEPPRSGAEKLKTKTEIVEDLGFSDDQANRFETLADNKDIVEYVKAEARENEDVPTRARVLELAANKKKSGNDFDGYFKTCTKVCNELNKIVENIDKFEITDSRINALIENFNGASNANDTIKYIEKGRDKLTVIIAEIRKVDKQTKEA